MFVLEWSSLFFRSEIVEENNQASEREIDCRVETWRECPAASVTRASRFGDVRARSIPSTILERKERLLVV